MSLPEKEMLNRVDLSSRRNDINDGMVLTDDGRAFQARVAACVTCFYMNCIMME